MTVAATLIPRVIRVAAPLPFNYKPHPAQLAFFNTPVVTMDWIPRNRMYYFHPKYLGIITSIGNSK